MMPIGAQLRRLREEKRISLRAMARMTGVQCYFIHRVEKGRASPSVDTLERIAHALRVQLWELFYAGKAWHPPRYLTDLHELAQEGGKAGWEARFFLRLRPILARIPEKDRGLFLSFAKGLARH